LLKQTFGLDVEKCPSCGGRMRLLALVTDPSSVARFLRHQGEPTEVPPRAAARAPPYFQSRAVRRQYHPELGAREHERPYLRSGCRSLPVA
ncbi:MAG: hypothetical protein ABI488_00075, partial [Polyangiaceae bacterium]